MVIRTEAEFRALLEKNDLGAIYAKVANRLAVLYDYNNGGTPTNPVVLGCLKNFTDNSTTTVVGENTCCEKEITDKYKFEIEISCPSFELLSLWHRSDEIVYNPVGTTASTLITTNVPALGAINLGRGRLGIVQSVDMTQAVVALVAPATPLTLVNGTHYRVVNGLITLLPHPAVIAAAGLVNAITVTAPRQRSIAFNPNTKSISDKILVLDFQLSDGTDRYRSIFRNISLSSLPAETSILNEEGLTPKFSFIANKDINNLEITHEII
jgi:hypothetical protein